MILTAATFSNYCVGYMFTTLLDDLPLCDSDKL